MTHYGPWPNSKDLRLTSSFELGLHTPLGSVLQLEYKVFLFYIKYNYSMKNKLHKNLMAHAPYLKIFTTHEIWPIMFTMHLIHHHIQSSIKQAQHINIYMHNHMINPILLCPSRLWEIAHFSEFHELTLWRALGPTQ